MDVHFFIKPLGKTFFIINRQKRIHINQFRILPQRVNVVPQNFRITCYNRTVVVITCAGIFLQFVRCAWIKDEFQPLLQKRDDMTVTYFTGIADGFGRNCLSSFFINIFCRTRRKSNSEPQFCKKRKPQRIIFIHI